MIVIQCTVLECALSVPADFPMCRVGSTISCRSKAGGEDGGRKDSERPGCVSEPRS